MPFKVSGMTERMNEGVPGVLGPILPFGLATWLSFYASVFSYVK